MRLSGAARGVSCFPVATGRGGDRGRAAGDAWIADYVGNCYHQTCDAWSADWDLRGAVQDIELFLDIIRELGGTAQQLPATTFVIALAGIALIGLPPSGAFLGKWQLLAGAVTAGLWLWLMITVIGSLLAAAYIFRVLGHAFGHGLYPNQAVTLAREEWPALLLGATAAVLLGLAGAPLWTLLEAGA